MMMSCLLETGGCSEVLIEILIDCVYHQTLKIRVMVTLILR